MEDAANLAPAQPGAEANLLSRLTAMDDYEFDNYADSELLKLKEELIIKNDMMENENKLFESYWNRVNPGNGGPGATGTVDEELQDAGGGMQQQQMRQKKKKGEKQKEIEKRLLLTPEQKSEIATRELEELRDEIEKQKEEWAKVLDSYKAEMEEVEIRIGDTKKALYEYKRDIVGQAVNSRTGKVMAERVLRYYEDKIRAKDAIIEKVRLKNATLKVQKNKLHLQLKQKEEMGEVLHAIDFDQLQIENKQYLTKIEERNAELLKLKMTAGNTVQILNFYKKKLQNITTESETLRTEISQRRDLLDKLRSEAKLVNFEKRKATRINDTLKKQIEEFRVPHVMEYVHKQAERYELQKKLKSWERKVEIGTMQAARVKKMWQHMCLSKSQKQANPLPRITQQAEKSQLFI
ncbi:uncharacterized protein BJ171DRAFT_566732 [Polychytrium aggregatum]|uniref:uncharacterized protein n=1 Tax=Polychytrium aggregatum TaxID=110093 RepID=UPI0022FF2690|nr:uncharacterized protein BJ171DRAFT_566732 [Polychytrium aggregatum]KAI9206393.1 hypothetical protein BJ171DRAFT_566732 [Polychytrium aggregatum]